MHQLREVLIKKWIPAEYIELPTDDALPFDGKRVKDGTHCYQNDFETLAYFHKWVVLENGVHGIVEMEDGIVDTLPICKIKFKK